MPPVNRCLHYSHNPISHEKWGGLASLEATGVLFDREKDRAGVGGFYSGVSSNSKNLLPGELSYLREVWGAELCYNAEITPWLHLTGDVQLVQGENRDDDPAVILGLRAVINF